MFSFMEPWETVGHHLSIEECGNDEQTKHGQMTPQIKPEGGRFLQGVGRILDKMIAHEVTLAADLKLVSLESLKTVLSAEQWYV